MSHHDVMVPHRTQTLQKYLDFCPKVTELIKIAISGIHGPETGPELGLVREYRVTGTSLVRDMVCI